MSGRNKFRELVRTMDEDPARRAGVEELARGVSVAEEGARDRG